MERDQHPLIPTVLPNEERILCKPIHVMMNYRYYVDMENALHVNSYVRH